MHIYTDGSCLGNPGPGGWAFIVLHPDGHIFQWGNSMQNTTNNIMELTAISKAISFSLQHSYDSVTIFSDSKYVIDGVTKWLSNWKNNNWKSSNNKCIKNLDLWKDLDFLLSSIKYSFVHVKAHSGEPLNELVDKLAHDAANNSVTDFNCLTD